jgi:uncharacterized protein YukE
MNRLPAFAFALVAGVQLASAVTPVEKVINLLTDLKDEVAAEGAAEAKTYDEFACFCKDTTEEKSLAITTGRDDIDSLSASIAEDTAEKVKKSSELGEAKVKLETLNREIAENKALWDKEKAKYEATAADLSKAISSLEKAIDAMKDSKGAFIQVPAAVRNAVKDKLAIAAAMGLIEEKKRSAVNAFLQAGKASVDPSDPSYEYHSDGIIGTLEKLLKDFRDEKADLDDEWGKSDATFSSTDTDKTKAAETTSDTIDELTSDISGLAKDIAGARGDLVEKESFLKDDQAYLKDLTERCEDRANDWDQRSALRKGELEALSGALEVLENKVQDADEQVNKRALLQKAPAAAVAVAKAVAKQAKIAPHATALVQEVQEVHAGASMQARYSRVAELLKKESLRIDSPVLSTLATKVKLSDPFTKIKGLIQELIERLLAESAAEATKKGFCDTELGKAEKDRDFRWKDAKTLNLELRDLQIKEADLTDEISLLNEELDTLKTNLKTTTVAREAEHEDNIEAIKVAKEGLAAVKEAITILKVFYKNAAKAKAFIQASPVDEDTDGAGFKGNYAGKQSASKGIIGMLEVIQTDFERTARTTEASEKASHEEFVKFDRTSKADIASKETKLNLDTEDLETTETKITQAMTDLQTQMNLLDSALERLEELKPMCIDSGMSYAKRVEKREEEMAALKQALCILDTNNVESECA